MSNFLCSSVISFTKFLSEEAEVPMTFTLLTRTKLMAAQIMPRTQLTMITAIVAE